LNDFYSGLWTACLLTEEEITVGPHRSKCYLWNIDPYVLGLPDKDGQQLLIGNFTGIDGFSDKDLTDTTTFYAPMFLGGQLDFSYKTTKQAKVDSIRESYNAELISHADYEVLEKSRETWQFLNIHIDTAYNKLKSNPIFTTVDYLRFMMYDSIYVTSVKKVDDLEKDFTLYQNYPNPFNPSTTIKFTIPFVETTRRVVSTKLVVYDILGQKIKTLLNKKLSPGSYEVEFDGSNLPSGVYLYRLTNENYSATKKMLLLK